MNAPLYAQPLNPPPSHVPSQSGFIPAPRVPLDLLPAGQTQHIPSQPPPPVVAAAPPASIKPEEKKEEKKPVLDPAYAMLPLGIFGCFATIGIVEAIFALFIFKTV